MSCYIAAIQEGGWVGLVVQGSVLERSTTLTCPELYWVQKLIPLGCLQLMKEQYCRIGTDLYNIIKDI